MIELFLDIFPESLLMIFQFLALTEEDLNKYDLTQGAKKKLKTQLELQKSAE